MIYREPGQGILLSHGPVLMTIEASADGVSSVEIAEAVAEKVVNEFELIKMYMKQLREMRAFKETSPSFPPVLNKMIDAVEKSGDPTLNTLAAVAGAFSEYAAEQAAALGATRVIVNNGGDIALVNLEPRPVKIGLGHCGREAAITIAADSGIGGICTSGARGRSFSKGIADSVTVMAETASVADACATVVANAVNIDDPAIIRCPAEDIDSGTDIAGQLVTIKVGPLTRVKRMRAALNGAEEAQRYADAKIISGAVISIGGLIVRIPDDLSVEMQGG